MLHSCKSQATPWDSPQSISGHPLGFTTIYLRPFPGTLSKHAHGVVHYTACLGRIPGNYSVDKYIVSTTTTKTPNIENGNVPGKVPITV